MLSFIKKLIKNNSRFVHYCLGGGLAFLVDLSLLYIFTEYLHLWYIWSATLSFLITAVVNYTIQKYWTFKNDSRQIFRQLTIFIIIQVIGLILNNVLLYCLVEFVGLWYILAKIIAAGLVLIWNFSAGKTFVFNVSEAGILIAGEIFPPTIGGPATYTHRLAHYFLSHQIDFSLVYYAHSPLLAADHALAPFAIAVNAKRPLPWRYLVYFFRLFFRSIHAKVIYAQGPVASGWPALLVSRLLRKKLVVKIVGDYAWEQAQLNHATLLGIDDWQKNPEPESKNYFFNKKISLLNKLERRVVRRADCVVVPSHYLKKIVLGWGADQSKVKVIYNSVSLKNNPGLSSSVAQDKINIHGDLLLTVARLLPWKGVAMLIEIMPELLKFNPSFKLVVVGNGPNEDHLHHLAAEKKLTDAVIFPGRVSQDDLPDYYQAASIFILNSGYEGLSHSIIDAMNYNLPVVASAIGGNPELIDDDYNGLLAEYNNHSAWVAAVKRLWQSEKLRTRLVASPLTKLTTLSFDNMITETLKILNNFNSH